MNTSSSQEQRNEQPPTTKLERITAGISFIGWLLFGSGLALAAAIASGWGDVLSVAKSDALRNLNTEFGAAIFLAGSISFIGFAVSQYWRFIEARRQYYIISNREQAEANARAERIQTEARVRAERQKAEQEAREYRSKERLLDNYQHQRSAIQSYSFWMDHAQRAVGLAPEDTSLQQLADALVRLAVGPERTVEDVTQADIDRLSIFRGYTARKQLEVFAGAVILKTPEMDRATTVKVDDLFQNSKSRTPEETAILIGEILSEIDGLQTRRS